MKGTTFLAMMLPTARTARGRPTWRAFALEEGALGAAAEDVVADAAGRGDDAVARHDEGDDVPGDDVADGAHGARAPDLARLRARGGRAWCRCRRCSCRHRRPRGRRGGTAR